MSCSRAKALEESATIATNAGNVVGLVAGEASQQVTCSCALSDMIALSLPKQVSFALRLVCLHS